MRSVGLDFGTTNSAIGVIDVIDVIDVIEGQTVKLARFAHKAGIAETFRSILYFHPEVRDAPGPPWDRRCRAAACRAARRRRPGAGPPRRRGAAIVGSW